MECGSVALSAGKKHFHIFSGDPIAFSWYFHSEINVQKCFAADFITFNYCKRSWEEKLVGGNPIKDKIYFIGLYSSLIKGVFAHTIYPSVFCIGVHFGSTYKLVDQTKITLQKCTTM